MTMTLRDRLGLIALLAAPLLLPFAIGRIEPLRGLFEGVTTPTEIAEVKDGPAFRIQGLARGDGMPIHAAGGFSQLAGASFGRTIQEALHARGRADAAAGAHVWAFMQGRGGEVYMQSPPVSFDGGDWVATNLRIGEPVARVLFVQVDEATHARLADKASRQDWSPSPQLPEGARTLASIGLR